MLYPIGLLAATAIIFPVIIHLWNIKQSKPLKIGSIALLGASSTQSSRSLRITDWFLFILRCLLLLLLAFLLAQPFLRSGLSASKDKGWILIERAGLKNAYRENRGQIDSLLSREYELHDLNVGFTALSLADTAVLYADSAETLSYSSLLRQLNSELPAGFKVYLFAENSLNRFEGDVPEVFFNLYWKAVRPPDTAATWISKAFFTAKDSIRTFLTHSTPAGNYTEVFNLSDQLAKNKKIELRLDSGRTQLRSIDQHEWVTADTSSIVISIYTDRHSDAAYVKAALMSIAQFSQLKIKVKQVTNPAGISPASNLVFWLSGTPLNAQVAGRLKENAGIFTYETGVEEAISSVINVSPEAGSSTRLPELFRRIKDKNDPGQILWSDGFGSPVLTTDRWGKRNRYRFYSRFSPQYTSLVWDGGFAKALMPVVIPSQEKGVGFGFESNALDRRQITGTQASLYRSGFIGKKQRGEVYTDKPLSNMLWLLAILVFTAERIISFRKATSDDTI